MRNRLRNPAYDPGAIKDAIYSAIRPQFPQLTQARFDRIWGIVETLPEYKAFIAKMEVPTIPAPVVPPEAMTGHDKPTIFIQQDAVFSYIYDNAQATGQPVSYQELFNHFIPADQKTEANERELHRHISNMIDTGEIIAPRDNEYDIKISEGERTLIQKNREVLSEIRTGKFDRTEINKNYNGLGVEVKGTGLFGMRQKRAKTLQQYYTSPDVAKFMVEFMNIPINATVYDPSCGSGRLLFACPNPKLVHGIEIETNAFNVARAQFPEGRIVLGSLFHHIYDDAFDYIVMNPPFSITASDDLGKFKFKSETNRIQSHLACLEIAARSVKAGGYFASILPDKTFSEHLKNSGRFLKWFRRNVDVIAHITLPATTHEGTEWPVDCWIFRRIERGGDANREWNNEKVFVAVIKNMAALPHILKQFREEHEDDYNNIMEYSKSRNSTTQVDVKPIDVMLIKNNRLFGEPLPITKDDVMKMEVEIPQVLDYRSDKLILKPNGLYADLKLSNLKAFYPPILNERFGTTEDVFDTRLLQFGQCLNGVIAFDDLEVVKRVRSFDCDIDKSPEMVDYITKKSKWFEFDNAPFEQWIDPDENGNWLYIGEADGYKAKYPKEWSDMQAKFDDMVRKHPWMGYKLANFQKEDCMRAAMKISTIMAQTMGLGKSRVSIATAFLKDAKRILLVVPSRLVPNWRKEFTELGEPAPFHIKDEKDFKQIPHNHICIISYEKARKVISGQEEVAKLRGLYPRGSWVKLKSGEYGTITSFKNMKYNVLVTRSYYSTYRQQFAEKDLTLIDKPYNVGDKVKVKFEGKAWIDGKVISTDKAPYVNVEYKGDYATDYVNVHTINDAGKIQLVRAAKENPVENPLDDVISEGLMSEFGLVPYNMQSALEGIRENPDDDEEDINEQLEKDEDAIKISDMLGYFSEQIAAHFDLIIVDEAHYLSNPTTHQTSALRKMNRHGGHKNWILLSGTPIANKVNGLYSLLEIGWGRYTPANPFGPTSFMTTFATYLTSEQKAEMEQKTLSEILGENKEVVGAVLSMFEETSGYGRSRGKKKSRNQKYLIPTIQNPEMLQSLMEGKWLRRLKYEPDVQKDIPYVKPTIKVHYPGMTEEHTKFYEYWFQNFEELVEKMIEEGSMNEEGEQKKANPILGAILRLQQAALMPQMEAINRPVPTSEHYTGGITKRQKEIIALASDYAKQGKKVYLVSCFTGKLKDDTDPDPEPESDESKAENATDEVVLDLFTQAFLKKDITTYQVSGKISNMEKRQLIVDTFAKQPAGAILVGSLGILDVGLNIPEADVCIIVHPHWNYTKMEQAWGRMLRPKSRGQKMVHVFVQDGTIDNYVWLIASMKKQNTGKVLDHITVEKEEPYMSWKTMAKLMIYDHQNDIVRKTPTEG